MIQHVPIDRLIDQMKELMLTQILYKPSTIKNYEEVGFVPLRSFIKEKGYSYFDIGIVEEYRKDCQTLLENGQITKRNFNIRIRVCDILQELSLTGSYEWNSGRSGPEKQVPELFQPVLDDYFEDRSRDISEKTYQNERSYLILYGNYLEESGINDLSEIDFYTTSKFIIKLSVSVDSMSAIISGIRKFVQYLCRNGFIDSDFSASIHQTSYPFKPVKSPISKDDENRLLEALDLNSPVGIRDYAVLKLTFDTGIRAIDVLYLKLTDIDWKNGQISFIQHKTGKPVTLPLSKRTLDALANYILKARPRSNTQIIFLRSRAPFTPFSSSDAFRQIFKHTVRKAGMIREEGDGLTFHGIRRTHGTKLVEAGSTVSEVADMLGHSSITPTKRYVSLDIEGLKKCCMIMSSLEKRS